MRSKFLVILPLKKKVLDDGMAELVVMGISCGKNKENMCLWTGFWVKIVMQHYIGGEKSLKENLKGKKSESFPIFKDQ